MDQLIDILLTKELPKAETRQYKIKRLSRHYGKDIYVTLRQLTYSQVADIKRMQGSENQSIHILLNSIIEPDLRSKELLDWAGAETPAELIKKLFTAGEIEDLVIKVERLSGYRAECIEEIKKK